MYKRKGSLFLDNFERILVSSESYYCKLIHYIHFNPVHHHFVNDLRDWKYSSYGSYFSKLPSQIRRSEVISWFDNIENFIAFHQKEIDDKMPFDLE